MAEFTRKFGRDRDDGGSERGGVATRETTREDVTTRDREDTRGDAAAARRETAAPAGHEVRSRQRDEFGGFNWGAAFFGWLVAIGIGVLLTAIVSAAGAAIGLTEGTSGASENAEKIGIVGGILLIAISMIAYYAGGYVAGRMSRFDGARQGLGVWLFGLLVTIAIAAAGAIFGDKYNVFEQLNLPRIPVSTSDLTTGGLIALAAILLGTLFAALSGGKVGERYHKKVDRVGFDA